MRKYKKILSRPDPIYNSLWMTKFCNKFMLEGKKWMVERTMILAFSRFKNTQRIEPMCLFFAHLFRHRPLLGFIKVRKSRQFKKVPVPLSSRKQLITVLSWFVTSLKKYGRGSLTIRIYNELIAIKKNYKSLLFRYKEFNELAFEITVNRVNNRFRWK